MADQAKSPAVLETFDNEAFTVVYDKDVSVESVSESNAKGSHDSLQWLIYDYGVVGSVQGVAEEVIYKYLSLSGRSYIALFAPIKGEETIKVFLNPRAIRSVTVGKLSKSTRRNTY